MKAITLTDEQHGLLTAILGSFGDNSHEMPDEAEYLAESFDTTPEALDDLFAALNADDLSVQS